MKRCNRKAGESKRSTWIAAFIAILAASPLAIAQETPVQPESKPQTAAEINLQAFELAKIAKSEEEFNKIIDLCQQGLEAQPAAKDKQYANNLLSWAFNKRGEARAELGQEAEAMADFEESLKLDANRWVALHNRGVSHGIAGDLDAAMADFNRVVQLNPNFSKAFYNRGELRFKRGDLAGAIADYSAALRLNSRDAGALTSRGFAYYSRGDYRNAMRDYNQALQIDPNNAETFTLRGDAQADQAQFAQAVQDYQAAVRVNPEYGRVYQSSAWLRATCPNAQFRHTDVALRNAQKAIDLDGETDHRYLETLAAAQANAGQFEDAKATQAKAIELAKGASISQAAANRMQERLTIYESNRPYRDVRPGTPQPRQ
jgi:tetratricopeptide (TPR) repeat protein